MRWDDESAAASAGLMCLDSLLDDRYQARQVTGSSRNLLLGASCICSSSTPERSAAFGGCRQLRGLDLRCSCALRAGTRAV